MKQFNVSMQYVYIKLYKVRKLKKKFTLFAVHSHAEIIILT